MKLKKEMIFEISSGTQVLVLALKNSLKWKTVPLSFIFLPNILLLFSLPMFKGNVDYILSSDLT